MISRYWDPDTDRKLEHGSLLDTLDNHELPRSPWNISQEALAGYQCIDQGQGRSSHSLDDAHVCEHHTDEALVHPDIYYRV
jgi:hypothetical protein